MQGWGFAVTLGALYMLAVSCGEDGKRSEGVSMLGQGEGAVCLEPPWAPSHASFSNAMAKCDDAREFGYVLGDGALASEEQLDAFLNRYRSEAHAVPGIVESGYGLCCEGHWSQPARLCLTYALRFCSTRVDSFVDLMERHRASDPDFAKLRLPITVELEGLTGVRCERDDPECDALPYNEEDGREHPPAPPPDQRRFVDPPRAGAKPCSYDGECVVNGCGNECDHWTDGAAAGKCPLLLRLQDAFCGCVESQCAWFKSL